MLYVGDLSIISGFQTSSFGSRPTLLPSTTLFLQNPNRLEHPEGSENDNSQNSLTTSSVDVNDDVGLNRRSLLQTATLGSLMASLGLGMPSPAMAAAAAADVSSTEILLRLRSIPAFCLVNPDGVPFMIFDGQASATGYFFLSFQVAAQALQDARQKDNNEGAAAIWAQTKIIVVPLAIALQLVLRKTQREAVNNGVKFNTFNDLVASSEGVDDAQTVEKEGGGSILDIRGGNPEKWTQKGRIPLFYMNGLTLADGREPRYFNQVDLLKEWKRQHPDDAPPSIQLVELVELYRNALGGKNGGLDKVSNLAIMPVQETNQVAAKLLKTSEGPPPNYSFDKVYLVGAAS